MAKTDEVFGLAYEKILMQLGHAYTEMERHRLMMNEYEDKANTLTKKALAFLDPDTINTAKQLESALVVSDESK